MKSVPVCKVLSIHLSSEFKKYLELKHLEQYLKLKEDIYFCFIDYAKAFDCVDHNKLGKILKEMGIETT